MDTDPREPRQDAVTPEGAGCVQQLVWLLALAIVLLALWWAADRALSPPFYP